ncbi:lipid kinase [uncultured Phenylobacterium sp.]|uniref:lipid kinase n=1 Tax=uncultured Phenylobacterium sp. TaxID=349273 RepID=UPI0025E86482|nr:lipid kinase [uncultured Phenylobacterium sp.]
MASPQRAGQPPTGSARRRGLMLVNPNARRGQQALEVIDRLAAGGVDVTVERFSNPSEVAADIVKRAAGTDLVIVCGGDGTVAAAAPGLLQTGLPMGILPLGTANDLARTLRLPLDLAAAAEVIVQGHTERIDMGEVNGHPFFNVASLGLSADLARGLTRESKRRWGRLAYAIRALQVLFAARPFHAEVINRQERIDVRTLQIAVGNGRHYGGGSVIHEHASIVDGHLDLYSLDPGSVWKLALMFDTFRRGRHGVWAEVQTSKCVEFDVRTRRPRSVNADGDIVTQTPAHFVVRPAAIEVFIPRPSPA